MAVGEAWFDPATMMRPSEKAAASAIPSSSLGQPEKALNSAAPVPDVPYPVAYAPDGLSQVAHAAELHAPPMKKFPFGSRIRLSPVSGVEGVTSIQVRPPF